MKKMLLGIFLLLLIIVAITVNSRIVHHRLTEMQDAVIETLSLPPSISETLIEKSFREWEQSRKYLALLINESRLDVISNAYFECMRYPDLIIMKNKLIYEIKQLIRSEKLFLESIF